MIGFSSFSFPQYPGAPGMGILKSVSSHKTVPQGQREASTLKPELGARTTRAAQGRNLQMARPEKSNN